MQPGPKVSVKWHGLNPEVSYRSASDPSRTGDRFQHCAGSGSPSFSRSWGVPQTARFKERNPVAGRSFWTGVVGLETSERVPSDDSAAEDTHLNNYFDQGNRSRSSGCTARARHHWKKRPGRATAPAQKCIANSAYRTKSPSIRTSIDDAAKSVVVSQTTLVSQRCIAADSRAQTQSFPTRWTGGQLT